jgi:hypothetical protein
MATEPDLTTLSEKEFTKSYLLPLYKAKGYQDVDYCHGGQAEKGKDITMWKFDAEQVRENYSVVVKAGDISGSASGRGSANEVSFQVRECFKFAFPDKRTAEDRVVHKCFVVTSGNIGGNSRTTISGSLDAYLERYIRFFEGSEILDQFAQFCPERNTIDEFLRTSVALQNQLKGVEVTARIVSGVRELIFRRTDGGADPEKWILQLNLNLDAINEEMQVKLKAFEEEGGSISLPKAIIKSVKLPDLVALIGWDPERVENFSLTQIPKKIGAFTLRKTDDNNQSVSLEHIELSVVNSGSVRYRLANKDDGSAFTLTIDIDRSAQTVTVSFAPLVLGNNAFAVYQAFTFLDALSRKGRLSLVNNQTGVEVVDEVIEGTHSKVSSLQLSLLRKLATIQRTTGTTIVINREILGTDLPDIEAAFMAVTEGRLNFEPEPIILNRMPGVNLEQLQGGPHSFVMTPSGKRHLVTIVDNEIDLGETEVVADNAVFERDEGGTSGRFVPPPGESFYINFVKYSGERKRPSDAR